MKKLLFVFFSFLISSSYGQTSSGAQINFSESQFDFGDISQGTKVEKSFKYSNNGTEPLIISDVVTTCGCTATKWTKEPLLPGQSRELLATFDSKGKEGRRNNIITIISNASNAPTSRLNLITNVLPANTSSLQGK